MKVIPSGDYILKWQRSDFYLNANAVYHFFPQCGGTGEGLDLIMNFWTQLLWRERLVGVAHESVACVFKTVFKYSFCIVILTTPARIPNHCGLDFAGIWKVADSERKPPLNREHVWLAWGPSVWALGVPKPWAKSPQLKRSGNACFHSAGLSPSSSAKCHPLVLQELCYVRSSVKLYQVLLEMRWATCCSRRCACDQWGC